MVAIVSGNGLGLNTGSLNTLGTALGNAVNGRDGSNVYVNASTGNLVVRQRDEYLAGLGVDASLLRTYNSQGGFGIGAQDGDNGDGWRMGIVKTVSAPSGGVNVPGSTLVRTDGDGSTSTYHYDQASGRYVSTDGDGAYDSIVLADDGSATWTDGASGSTEHYDVQGRLQALADTDGNVTRLAYDANGMVSSITEPDGDVTYLDYDGTHLTQVRTVSAGVTETRSRYAYDAQGRLSQVTVDLSPEDGSIADGNVYTTSYTYDGASTRLASITQSDGSSLSFTYVDVGGRERIDSVTDALGAVTRYHYDVAAGTTDVTDPAGGVTTLTYDASGQLTSVLRPAVDGVRIQNSYQYDSDGNLIAMVDGNGQSVTMTYDGRGNVLTHTDGLGQTVSRTYDAANHLLTEAVGDTDSGTLTVTRYVYNAQGHLRFAIDGSGTVLEQRYGAAGEMVAQLRYTAARFDVSALDPEQAPSEADMATWSAAQSGESIQRTDYAYDFRGQLSSTTRYGAYDADGNGIGLAAVTRYVYDQRGRLLTKIEPGDSTVDAAQTLYAYDALDRLLGSVDALGNRTTYQYDDAQRRTVTTYANGLASTQVFDAAGRLVSTTQTDAAGNAVANTTRNHYDAAGRLIESIDANGSSTLYLYDAANRQVGTIDSAGALTESVYDGNGNVVRTVQYATALDRSTLQAGIDLDAVRPASSAQDRVTRQFYDADNRLVATVDPLGFATRRDYDTAGNLARTVSFANSYDINGSTDATIAAEIAARWPSEDDRSVRFFYDGAGRVVGQLDAEGNLSVTGYDGAGNQVETIRYANATDPDFRDSGTLAKLTPQSSDADIHTQAFYDAEGRQVGSVDGEGYLTETQYDAAGNVSSVVRYASAVTHAGVTLDAVRPQATAADQRQVFTYDGMHRLTASVGVDGTRTVNVYDSVGDRVSSTVAAGTSQASTSIKRYDVLGRVTAQLSADGAAALTGNPGADALVWAQYATTYTYDARGRLTSAEAPGGNRTLYFYDAQGRVTQTVDALGDVKEATYDIFGEITSTKTYAERLYIPGTEGGDAAALAPRLSAIADAVRDTVQRIEYDARGAAVSTIDGLGQSSVRRYDAFGDVVRLDEGVDTPGATTTEYTYDRRGLVTETDAVNRVYLTSTAQYDAFGRMIGQTDARGNTAITQYDRDGRVIVQRDRLNDLRTTTYDAFDRVLTQTDGNGNVTRYAYDDQARSMTMTTADGVQSTVQRDAAGHVIRLVDGDGAATRYTYDADGNLLSTTDALGNTVEREYDAGSRLIATIDQNGVRTQYYYDAANRLLEQVVDAGGLNLTTRYAYDTHGEVVSATDPNGIETTTSYDADGHVLRTVLDPTGLGIYTEYSYDAQGNVLSVTKGGPNDAPEVTQYTYDGAGRRTRMLVDPDDLHLATDYEYDADGNVTSVNDPNGNVTTYTYDAEGRVLSQTSALGNTTTYTYDANGNRISVTDGNGDTSTSRYDVHNRLVSQTDANGNTTSYAYDGAGNLISSTDALGATTLNAYDAAGRLIQTTNALGHVTNYGYDAAGNRISVSDDVGTTSYRYDAANRLVGVTDPLGGTTSYTLDAGGNRIGTTDARGVQTSTVYDTAGRVIATTDGLGDTTSRVAYDAFGNEFARMDGDGNVSMRSYDGANRLIIETDSLGNTYRYTYDKVGNRTAVIDPNGVQTDYIYDRDNRLIINANDSQLGSDIEYQYDAAGNLVWMKDRNGGETLYTYDAVGQLVTKEDPTGAITTYGYDAAGNRVTVADADGNVTKFVYDALGRQVGIIDALGQTQTFVYDSHGNRIEVTDQNGHSTHYAYDANNRLVSVTDNEGNVERYEYDAVGNRTAKIDKRGNVTRYAYDAASRLVSTGDALGNFETYAYDPAGNLIATTDKNGNTTTRSYIGNRLADVTDANGYTTTYGYDATGNVTSTTDANGNSVEYRYDEMNRRIQASDSSGDTYYAYDGNGNLIQTMDANGNVSWSKYDALGRVISTGNDAAGQVASYEYDAAGNLVRSVAYFKASDDGIDSGFTTYTYDALNRRISTTDSLGNTQHTEYDAVGNVTATTDGNGNRTSYRYDDLDRRIAIIDALGGVATSEYDAVGNVVAKTDRTGATTTYAYDATNRLIATTDALGYTATYAYDAVGNRISETDRTGSTTIMTYDAVNRLLSKQQGSNGVETYGYDGVGNRISYTNARGYTSTFTYDAQNRLTSETDATGASTNYEYDAAGNRTAVWQGTRYENDLEQDYWYDADNRQTAQIDVKGQNRIEQFTYDEQGNRLTSGDHDHPTRYDYDTENHLIGIRTPEGNYTRFEYDAAGNRTAMIDPNGNRTEYRYDALNRLVATIDPSGHADTITYDAEGNKVSTTDRNGNTIRYEYDVDHRLTAVTGPDGQRTEYALDAEGRHLSETIAAGTAQARTTSYTYDQDGHVLSVLAPDGSSTYYEYDSGGNVFLRTVYGSADDEPIMTMYAYDGDNRLIRTVIDFGGLEITEQQVWNELGQLSQTIDGAGRKTTYTYDNRGNLTDVANGKLLEAYNYNDAGDLIYKYTPAEGAHSYTYDNDHRLVGTSLVLDGTYDYDKGWSYDDSGQTVNTYDAAGNVVRSVDAEGHVTNNYFDANNRLVAQLDGDDVLHEYDYDAVGNKIAERLYMTPMPGAHDATTRPVGSGEVRVYKYSYDSLNRLVRTEYPAVQVTQLTTVNGVPTTTTNTVVPVETRHYDAFGNLVELVTADGQRTVSYYDAVNRLVGQVDPRGYLTQYDYDVNGNVLEKRAYATALDQQDVDSTEMPTVPAGNVTVTSSVYDSAGRQVEQRVAGVLLSQDGVAVADITAAAHASQQAVVTDYVRDGSGNVIREISAPGEPEQQTKYYYYTSGNQLMATIDARRSLTLYSSDWAGVEGYVQFGDPIDPSIDLDSLTADYDQLTQSVDTYGYNIKGEVYTRDRSGHITSIETSYGSWQINGYGDSVDIGLSGELVDTVRYGYDADGNRTLVDNNGSLTSTKYNAAGKAILVRQPDGSTTHQVYDAAGNATLSYSGGLESQPQPASSISATLNNGIQLSYSMPEGNQSSYVVWDTVSHDLSGSQDIGSYANETNPANSGTWQGHATIPVTHGQVFYRVVTVDAAGNKAYSSEQKVSARSDVQDVQIVQASNGQVTVRVKLADGASAPVLRYGMYVPTSRLSMTQASDGYYEAKVSPGDPRWFWLAFDWTGADGSTNSSSQTLLPQNPAEYGAAVQAVEHTSGGSLSATLNVTIPASVASSFAIVTADWRLAGSNGDYATTGAQGDGNFALTLDGSGALQAGQTYEVVLRGVDPNGNLVTLGNFKYTPTGTDGTKFNTNTLILGNSSVGDSHLVVVNGQPVPVTKDASGSQATIPSNGSNGLAVYYTAKSTETHTTSLTSSQWLKWVPNVDAQGVDHGQYVQQGYNLAIGASLSADEAANVVGGLHISWRNSGSSSGDGTTFPNDAVMSADGTNYTYTLSQLPLPAKSLDYKIWYTDAAGHQVIVDWSQARTDTSATTTGRSDVVLANETGGSILSGTVSLGARTGQLEKGNFFDNLGLSNVDTGLEGGFVLTNPIDQGYVRRNTYDAMNHLIGSTGDDGVWTDYGVDLRGDAVSTTRHDADTGETIASYAEYDEMGRVTAQYGPAFTTADGSTSRNVTRYEYDRNGNVVKQTDASGATTTMTYDAFNRLVSQTDALGHSKSYTYDSLGHLMSLTDENGNVTTYQYDAGGDRILQTDATGVQQGWRYDAIGRVIAKLDGNGNVTDQYTYDNKDRVFTSNEWQYQYNPVYGSPGYTTVSTSRYDGLEARGTSTTYDAAGRIVDGPSGTNSYDTYGNLIAQTDLGGRTTRYVYGPYGRLLSTIDPDGNAINYTYDSLGRKVGESGGGRNIQYSYDAAGHLLEVNDIAVGTVTHYEYDAVGRQVHETVTTRADAQGTVHQRDITTTFDALGRVVHWEDAASGMQETMTYDAVGNRIEETGSGPGSAIDHGTDFDAAGRVVALRENGVVVASYTYDANGNRATYSAGNTTASYTYDSQHRVLTATTGDQFVEWQYDLEGNITYYRESTNGVAQKTITNQYDNLGKTLYTKTETRGSDGKVKVQETTNQYDFSERLVSAKIHTSGDADKTYYYRYTYAGDGRELKVQAYGSASGNSSFTYDADNNLVALDQGKGDGMSRKEMSTFVYDNEGHILAKYHDDGKSSLQDKLDYVYVQGNPVAQAGVSIEAGGQSTVLDAGNYALFRNIDSNYPNAASLVYTVQAGETLQSIADRVYGNPSLWYLIADANDMSSDVSLAAGQVIRVPSPSNSGPITSDTHAVYNQDDVTGSTAPNLQSPSSGHGCSGLLHVLVAVVAVAVAVYTAGVAAEALGAATSTAGALGDAALAGAAGGAAGSVAGQGLAIATGLQDHFSWKDVAQGAVSGAVTAGVGAYAQTSGPGASFLRDAGIVGQTGVGNALTQELAKVTHLQDNFSWRSVGAAAAAAGIGSEVRGVQTPSFIADAVDGTVLSDPFAAQLVRGSLANTANAVTQQLLGTGRVDLGGAVLGAISNVAGGAIGNVLVQRLAGMTSQSDGAQSTTGTPKPISQEQAERNMYGGMTARQVLGGDKDWLSALRDSEGPYGISGNDDRTPNYQAPIPQVVVDAGDVNDRLNAIFGLTPKNIGPVEALPTQIDSLAAAAAADRLFYASRESGASNGYSAAAWHIGGLLNEVGYDLAKTARGAFRLVTDSNTQADAYNALKFAANNPGVIANNAIQGFKGFANKPFAEQADSIFKFGAGGLVTAGAGKLGVFAVDAAITGASATAKWLAPKAGELFENYMYRSGGIAYAVDPNIAAGSMSGPVIFKAPANATAEQLAQFQAYVDGSNEALAAGYISPTGRVSTAGTLRIDASLSAAEERAIAAEAGTPYQGHAGHVPDTTWTGKPEPYAWLDLDPAVNSSLGAQARWYPIGYQPTKFIFKP